jgi:hypothetical protein
MGAMAQYFFWRWHLSGEAPPSFKTRQNWYRIKVLVGKDREQELSFPTHFKDCAEVLEEAYITADSVTHVIRGSGARHAELQGVSEAQVSSNSFCL